jgi:hypothetical protein
MSNSSLSWGAFSCSTDFFIVTFSCSTGFFIVFDFFLGLDTVSDIDRGLYPSLLVLLLVLLRNSVSTIITFASAFLALGFLFFGVALRGEAENTGGARERDESESAALSWINKDLATDLLLGDNILATDTEDSAEQTWSPTTAKELFVRTED